MIFTPARENDVAAILDLEHGGFPVRERWSKLAWRDELLASDRYVLTGRDADDRVQAVATFQCVGDVADLHRIIVSREHRGEGTAKRMVRAGMEWAQALGAERMLLEVREDNDAAIGLYDGTGFEVIARRNDYYGPGAHALVMAASLDERGRSRSESGDWNRQEWN